MESTEREMWDAIVGVAEPVGTSTRLMWREHEVCGHTVKVSRIVGTRLYVWALDGIESPARYEWTIDAFNAALEAAHTC